VAARETASDSEQRVTPLELFFDLVFVFAITQITQLMARDPTWRGLAHGLLVLGALWWAWVGYSWLTNAIDPEEGWVRLAIFASMAAMLVASLAVPGAFSGDGLLFAGAYFVVRVLHLILFDVVPDPGAHAQRRAVRRLAPSALIGSVLLIVATGLLTGIARDLLWCVALAIDYLGPMLGGVRGWRVSAGHFAERHGLIVLIALGESVVAVGAATGKPVDTAVVVAGVLSVALAGALWWAYFDVVALVAESRLRGLTGENQNRVARDSYSYLHLAMVGGIILVALGIKQSLVALHMPLSTVSATALYGGVALYLTGHILFRLRNVHTLNRQRTVAAVVLVALIPVADQIEALAALAMVTTLACTLIAYEAIRFSDARQRVRHAAPAASS